MQILSAETISILVIRIVRATIPEKAEAAIVLRESLL
jgi:hypothetical protein